MRLTAQITDLIFDKLDEQTDEALQILIQDCHQYTTGNCGWVEYRIKDVIAVMAENALKGRREMEEGQDESAE